MPTIGTISQTRIQYVASPTFGTTLSHTVAAGSDRALYVCHVCDTSQAPSSVSFVATYGGVAMEQFYTGNVGSFRMVWWVLTNPTVGTADVYIGGAPSSGLVVPTASICAINVTGVDADRPALNVTSASGSSTTPSLTVTSATGDLVVDITASLISGQVFTKDASQTLGYAQDSVVNANTKTAVSSEAGAASTVMSWTLGTTGAWTSSGFSIPAAGTVSPPDMRVTQVVVETVALPDPDLRITQAVVETVTSGTGALRITQVVVETITPTPTTAQYVVPAGAVGVLLTAPGSAWTNSSYVEMSAAMPSAVLTGLSIRTTLANGSYNFDCELDIATGAASSEVVIATFRFQYRDLFGIHVAHPRSYFALPIGIDNIGSGVRLSARLRVNATTALTLRAAITFFRKPLTQYPDYLTTAQPVVAIPAATTGPTLTTPNSSWGNSSYVQLRSASGAALVVVGVAVTGLSGSVEIDLATGAAASETVITTLRMRGDAGLSMPGWLPLPNPLDNIAASTRIAARIRGDVTGSIRIALLAIEKPL